MCLLTNWYFLDQGYDNGDNGGGDFGGDDGGGDF